MNAAAARLAEATDIGAASQALGALARTCGDCHATLGGPAAPIGEAPEAEDGGVTLRMKRHRWAEARLWDGLVVPSDRAWRAGAHALADAPLVPAADVLAQSVHALGRKAIVVGARVDRGAVYGELMATCASCHALVR